MLARSRRDHLYRALRGTLHGAAIRGDQPLLTHVLLESEPGSISLTTYNRSFWMRRLISADVTQSGSLVTPAKLLTELIGALDSADVELRLDQSVQQLVVTTEYDETQLQCGNRDMFPDFPLLSELQRTQLDLNQFLRALEQTIGAARQDAEDTPLSGVHFEMRAGLVLMVAGDGSRVAERKLIAASHEGPEMSFTVPVGSLKWFRDLADGEEGPATLGAVHDGRYVEIAVGAARLVSHAFEGRYPEHSGLIPTGALSRGRVARRDLISKLEAALLLAPAGHRVQLLLRGTDLLQITTEGTELGRTRHELASENEGDETDVTVDGESLARAAGVMDGDQVEILTGPGQHVLLKPTSTNDLIYVICRMTQPPSVSFHTTQ
ncbi:MAG TPA: DNA polymerase III subunit beta [Candidatus Acidoferrum sp.]|nr:DNA polymerase III subunit beta [Candidatus Acidoferrum sp.]